MSEGGRWHISVSLVYRSVLPRYPNVLLAAASGWRVLGRCGADFIMQFHKTLDHR